MQHALGVSIRAGPCEESSHRRTTSTQSRTERRVGPAVFHTYARTALRSRERARALLALGKHTVLIYQHVELVYLAESTQSMCVQHVQHVHVHVHVHVPMCAHVACEMTVSERNESISCL